jgi:hypothetical protein
LPTRPIGGGSGSEAGLVGGLYFSGSAAPGFYAPVGTDPTADITGWRNAIEAGEPYGAQSQAILDEITQHHSSYYIDHSIAPAPMLMSSGFTDDLFPASETIRYYNRTRTQYPDAHLALFFGDFRHPRAQNKADVTRGPGRRRGRLDGLLRPGHRGAAARAGVTSYTLTCPDTAHSGGLSVADNWSRATPGGSASTPTRR